MSFITNILADVGIGSGLGTNPTTGQTVGQPFDEAQKDFIKLQFKYGLLLKQKLASGQISQAYYDANFWLTTQTLTPPYNGWWSEFKTAINAEDLDWLLKQVGGTRDELVKYMGDALSAVASTAGKIVGTAISSTSTGVVKGFFGSLNLTGWLVVGGIGFGVYYAYKKGYIQRVFGHEFSKLIP